MVCSHNGEKEGPLELTLVKITFFYVNNFVLFTIKLGPIEYFWHVLISFKQIVVAICVLVASFDMPHLISKIYDYQINLLPMTLIRNINKKQLT